MFVYLDDIMILANYKVSDVIITFFTSILLLRLRAKVRKALSGQVIHMHKNDWYIIRIA